MSPDNIMRSDVLDILFENRNKEYGAYMLRKTYDKRLKTALIAVATLALLFAVLNQLKPQPIRTVTYVIPDIDSLEKITEPEKPKEPEQPKPQQQEQVASRDFQTFRVVPDELVEDTIPTIDVLEKVVISDVNTEGELTNDRVITATQKDSVTVTEQTANLPEVTVSQIFEHAEKMPAFPGGIEGLKKYMLRNLIQPDDLEEGQKLVVIARFIVREDGTIDEASITKTGRPDLDKEVLRVIRKMPVWEPGKQNGKQVSVWFQLPVTFVSEN